MKDDLPKAAEVYAACICLGLNRAARGTARRYDAAFRPLGVTSGQYSILSALLRDAPTTIGQLAALLGMERTTLKRNLAPLEGRGLIRTFSDPEDRRIRRIELAQPGRGLLIEAVPLWRAAQAVSTRRLGAVAWPDLKPTLDALT